MNVDQFLARFGAEARPIDTSIRDWRRQEVGDLLNQPITAGVLVGDYLLDGSLIDNVPPEILEAASLLGGDTLDSRTKLVEHMLELIERGDASVAGAIARLKGQVGENLFLEELGGIGRLADVRNQEAWDIAIDRGIEGTQYVQVKVYADPNQVIAEMREVQEAVATGTILDGDWVVGHVDFAVPQDIAAAVRERMAQDPTLASINVLDIPVDGHDITATVTGAFSAVGEESIEQFFGQLFGATVTAAALHGAASAFLVYKQAKTVQMALRDAAANSAISTASLSTGMLVDYVLSPITTMSGPAGVIVGIGTRAVIDAWARSRADLSVQLADYVADLADKTRAIEALS